MKNVVYRGPPSEHYRRMTIESYVIPVGLEETFLNRLRTNHPDAALIMYGLDQLSREGSHSVGDELPTFPAPFESTNLAEQARRVLWLRVMSKNGREHLAGLLEWRAITPEDVALTGVYVAKQFRRRGLGTALMREAVREMKAARHSSALALVPGKNWIASHFLASRDFCFVLEGDDGTGDSCVHDLEAPRCFYRSLRQELLFPEDHLT